MRVALGLPLLLLGLCGSGAQGEGGGLNEAGDISEFQKTAPRDADEEWTEQTAKQTTPDIWAEVRALRDMVVELKVELKNMAARVKDSESQVDELKAELIVTKVHMELLQRENTVQDTQMKSLETQLKSLETRLTATETTTSDLEEKNAVQETQLMSLENRLTATETKTSDLEEENADLQTRLRDSESELVVAKSRIEQLERENAEKPKVAFFAGLTDAGFPAMVGPHNTDIPLTYSKVYINIGDAYNPATGIFTAPVNGVYYFRFTVSGSFNYNIGVRVYKNNEKIADVGEVNSNINGDHFKKFVVLDLKAEDEIHLVVPSGYSVYHNGIDDTTFSGALLVPL